MARATIAAQTVWLNPAAKYAKGQRSVANWDEDAITMAVEAVRALPISDQPVGSISFATTTAPFADRSNVGLLAAAAGLDNTVLAQDVGGSQRAATTAMLAASAGLASVNMPARAVIVGADRRVACTASAAELRYGDASAAVILGRGDGAAELLGCHSVNRDFVHQFRAAAHGKDYLLEDRWIRDMGVMKIVPDVLHRALDDAGLTTAQLHHVVLDVPTHHAQKLCQALKLPPPVLGRDLHMEIGEVGAGAVLLKLAATLEIAEPDQIIAVVGFGQGCDVALFRTTSALKAARPEVSVAEQLGNGEMLTDYLKLPAFSRMLEADQGIRAEADKRTALSVHARRHHDINEMRGSCCTKCDTPHFPSARVCVACGATDQMTPYAFAHRGARIKTFTEDWQSVTPAPPLCYGNIAFEGGGNAFLEFTDVAPGSLSIGASMSMHFRIKDYDDLRGFRRYFWKPAPMHSISASQSSDDHG